MVTPLHAPHWPLQQQRVRHHGGWHRLAAVKVQCSGLFESGWRCSGSSCVCDATSCPNGCCDANKQCHASANATCGMAGAACKACASGQECNAAGSCVCDAASCAAGCCSSGACVTTEVVMRLRRVGRSVLVLFERPALQWHQLRVRRDLLPERLLRQQQPVPHLGERHLRHCRRGVQELHLRARMQCCRKLRVRRNRRAPAAAAATASR